VTYTWLLVYENYADRKKAKAVEMMIEYGLTEGQTFSTELGYVPLPPNVIERVAAAADRISSDYQIKTKQ
jgi:phosphate transport system substrate-binding protein